MKWIVIIFLSFLLIEDIFFKLFFALLVAEKIENEKLSATYIALIWAGFFFYFILFYFCLFFIFIFLFMVDLVYFPVAWLWNKEELFSEV